MQRQKQVSHASLERSRHAVDAQERELHGLNAHKRELTEKKLEGLKKVCISKKYQWLYSDVFMSN